MSQLFNKFSLKSKVLIVNYIDIDIENNSFNTYHYSITVLPGLEKTFTPFIFNLPNRIGSNLLKGNQLSLLPLDNDF